MIHPYIIHAIQQKKPKIHSITNTITINDCANIILAAGGSATMATALDEVAEMTSLCDGLVLNLGAVSSFEAMLAAGQMANSCNHPIVFDPVAAGATKLRRDASRTLMQRLQFAAIRGNAAEIGTLASLCSSSEVSSSFVDADESQVLQENNLEQNLANARCLSLHTDAIVVVSGKEDLVVYRDSQTTFLGGSQLSSRITGSGCMLSELIATCLAANPLAPWDSVCTAVCWMNDCAKKAARKTQTAQGGTMTFRMYLIDEISKGITDEELDP